MNPNTSTKLTNEKFLIVRIFGAYYEIFNYIYGYKIAYLRGKFRLQAKEERNPIAVGDFVIAQESADSKHWVILERLDRRNQLIRKNEKEEIHVLCANVDQVFIIASLAEPETKLGFIDRAIAATVQSQSKPIVIFTKKDLVSEEEVAEKVDFYKHSGFETLAFSIFDENSIKELKTILNGKTTYLVGNSGVGKSSILNKIKGEEIQRVSEVSESTHKGKHTTTNSYALCLENNTIVIDSPGIKEWGIMHLQKLDVLLCFPEFAKIKETCTFFDCCDLSENCAMMKFLYSEDISPERQLNILSMLESFNFAHKIRTGNLITGKIKKRKPNYNKTKSKKFYRDNLDVE